MLKRKLYQKIIVASAALFSLMLLYLIPINEEQSNLEISSNLEYVSDVQTHSIFLLDNNQFLGKTDIVVNSTEIEAVAMELLETLIKGGELENRIPSGFVSLIPANTKIISIKSDGNLLKVDFSKELLDTTIEHEEKIIESIVYSLTSIEGIDSVVLYIDGEILSKLPQTNVSIPSILTRDFGINKIYDFTKIDDISQVTIYYMNKHNDNYYYVPVTKYLNDDRDKIKIVIEELSSYNTYNTNLISYLDYKTELISYEQDQNLMELSFNSYIFNDINEKNIKEEVIYTICLSIKDNYDVNEVVFTNQEIEIYKNILSNIK